MLCSYAWVVLRPPRKGQMYLEWSKMQPKSSQSWLVQGWKRWVSLCVSRASHTYRQFFFFVIECYWIHQLFIWHVTMASVSLQLVLRFQSLVHPHFALNYDTYLFIYKSYLLIPRAMIHSKYVARCHPSHTNIVPLPVIRGLPFLSVTYGRIIFR